MNASKWTSASHQLQASWTTQQDARIAALEKQLQQSERERKRLADELTVCSQRCVELEQAAQQSSSMLWNVTKRLVTTSDVYDRPIVRLPAVVSAVSSLPPGSELRTDAKLQVGRVVACLPEFQHRLTKTDIKLEDGSLRAINFFEDVDLPVLLPVLFEWIEKQPFTVWEDAFDLVKHRLSSHLIPDMANIVLGYLGAPVAYTRGFTEIVRHGCIDDYPSCLILALIIILSLTVVNLFWRDLSLFHVGRCSSDNNASMLLQLLLCR